MPKRTADHHAWLLEQLNNPMVAAHYLNAAMNDSPRMFLKALRSVAEAHKMAKVAKKAKVTREALYKTLSGEGNPRLATLKGVLNAVGLHIIVEPATLLRTPIPSKAGGQSESSIAIKPEKFKLSGVQISAINNMNFTTFNASEIDNTPHFVGKYHAPVASRSSYQETHPQ
jgi:probable addiction module antidote protein